MPEQPPTKPWQCPLEALLLTDVSVALGTRPQGFAHAEVAVHLHHYGRNTIHTVEPTPRFRKLLAHFTHLMALLLWVGGRLGFLAQMPQLGVAMWLVT
jgi:Ca2+-transporting ATPase